MVKHFVMTCEQCSLEAVHVRSAARVHKCCKASAQKKKWSAHIFPEIFLCFHART